MYGRRRVLLFVLGVLAAGILVAALAGNLAVLVTGRVLQGAGGAILPLAFGIVRHRPGRVPRERVGIAVGLLSALLGAGGGLGIVLAGPIVADLDWHWLFWFPLMAIALAAVGIVFGVPESSVRAPGGIDVPGTLLLQLPAATGFGLGKSVSEAGLFLLPATAAMVVFAPLSGALDRHFGAKLPLVVGILMATASYVLLAVAHNAAWQVLTAVSLMGVGIGLASAAMTNAILATVPPSQTSVATSINTLARTIGGSIGTAVIAAILTTTTTGHSPSETGFTTSFWICAGTLVVAVLAALLVPAPRDRDNESK
jgi:MFS family permease